ncbi:hypothetical protein KK083_20310 [Fulvivirgaceae bacterium PWU4]|uniref:Uncharacterized protein n=1 Tax=Chryseosolibacter histidini TaxID=2782349 RepID=A0AAP2DQQ3_9BACT|nr:hypothetical protein [Chryseosolibacter histidini]MBT1699252.1 hypothetical protein [Chryseosolibacter histidini]
MIDLKQLKRTSLCSNALMVLTSIHHIYGAVIYSTPWRLHVIFLSAPVLVATIILEYLLKKNDNKVLFWLYAFIVLIPSLSLIGLFEGIYNHILKDIMFYAGFSEETMLSMFPPPTYEMPNDFLFEFTGVLQGVACVLLTVTFFKLIRGRLKQA